MRSAFIVLAILVMVLFGAAPASQLIYAFMGPWTASGVQHDGTMVYMAFGQNLPRPDWIPIYPGASVVQASMLTSVKMPSGFGRLELSTRAGYEDVRDFYLERLRNAGFATEDLGIAPLNEATAAWLGIAGNLSGRRTATDDAILVIIRTADGIFPSRLVELRWSKISEGQEPPVPPTQ